MNPKKAFTLAEALIVLTIIGVVMVLTITTFSQNYKEKEYRAGLQKALNNLNLAYGEYFEGGMNTISSGVVTVNSDPVAIGSAPLNSQAGLYDNLIKVHLRPITTGSEDDFDIPIDGCPESGKYFYTADGMRYCLSYTASSSLNTTYSDFTYGELWVDVNGERGPNSLTLNVDKPRDTYGIIILSNRFIPGSLTNSAASNATREVFFGKTPTE